ncbi:MAG: hypothetical protein AAF502_10140 [Bacteroidota bacterium]
MGRKRKILIGKRRTQVLRNMAYRMGMDFSEEDDWGLLEYMRDFKLFRKGRKKKITNIMRNVDEWMEVDIRIFDYAYQRGKNDQKKTFRQTVFFVKSKKLGIPELFMKPETFFNMIGTYLGMQDIDFERYPQFSKQYLLQGDDEELVREAMSDEVLQFFTVEKNWTLEGVNYFLVFYRNNRLMDPRRINRFYKKGLKLHDMFVKSSF